MIRKNARLVGYLLVLGMVLASLWYFQNEARAPKPPEDTIRDVPPLGQVPTEEQIHGPGPPPPAKGK